MSINILSSGRGLPKYVLTNEELSKRVDTSDEWIRTRTGISTRFICTTETLVDLAVAAAKNALANANLSATDIDYIICSTVSGDYLTPSLSCQVQKEIGATCPSFDLNAACSGFIYAIDTASAFLQSGKANKVLVISAEAMSKHIDWNDRATCVLFGDGAGAVVLTKGDGLLAIKVTAKGNEQILNIGANFGNCPFAQGEQKSRFLYMKGSEVYKFAVSAMCDDVLDVLKSAGLTVDDVDMIIPHQANKRIIEAAKARLGVGDEKIACAIEKYGNTSSASIPILLSELMELNKLKKGNIIVLTAFGGGLTTGACVIKL